MRQIATNNPHTLSVLVRITPALRDGLDAWLGEINAHVVGPRWSRTDLLREALAYVARTRPPFPAPPMDIQYISEKMPIENNFIVPMDIPKQVPTPVPVSDTGAVLDSPKPSAPKAKAKPRGAIRTPAVPARARPTPDGLRRRCKTYCTEHPDVKPVLAKAMGYHSIAALGNWLRGNKTASEVKQKKAERWLEKQGS